jgi:thioredoxin-related protein
MNFLKKVILFLCTTLFLFGSTDLKHANSYTDAIEQGKKQNKHVVLFTHSPFCPWCRKMETDTLENPKVIKLLNEKYIFVSIDISTEIETDDVPSEYLPQGTPTTFVIDPSTQNKLFTMRGYKAPKSFLWRLNK